MADLSAHTTQASAGKGMRAEGWSKCTHIAVTQLCLSTHAERVGGSGTWAELSTNYWQQAFTTLRSLIREDALNMDRR